MNGVAVRAGVAGGVVAGLVMAVWLTVILWLAGSGFFTLLNLIANTFWRTAPLGPTFSLPAVLIALVVHLVVSVLFGVLIAVAASRLPRSRSLVIAAGAVFGPLIWVVMQYGIWRALDPAAARVISWWIFGSAHLLFGLIVATIAAITIPDHERSAAGRIASPAHGSHRVRVAAPAASQAPHTGSLTARNDGGMRTRISTIDGLTLVTDDVAARGGVKTAPTPVETMIGALCGSVGATFATAAREFGLAYEAIDFEVSFTQDPLGAAGEPPRLRAVSVQARVRGAEPGAWLPDVAAIAEQRCPVRNLLSDAAITLEMTWTPSRSADHQHSISFAGLKRRELRRSW
jgi:uncharacterized OsmC-like protein